MARVHERVRAGGHAVPESVVRRRFRRGLANLFQLYEPIVDSSLIFDSSGGTPRMVAFYLDGRRYVFEPSIFALIEQELAET